MSFIWHQATEAIFKKYLVMYDICPQIRNSLIATNIIIETIPLKYLWISFLFYLILFIGNQKGYRMFCMWYFDAKR